MKKYVDIEELCKYINEYKKHKKTIVFVNGCFDILHIGHIDLLKKAKHMGDILVVALNSDESIKRNKGDRRPVFHQDYRIMMLEAIAYIDHIILFNDINPGEIISQIKPDIICKGEDYRNKDMPEMKQIIQCSSRIEFCKYSYNISTSQIIKKIRNQ